MDAPNPSPPPGDHSTIAESPSVSKVALSYGAKSSPDERESIPSQLATIRAAAEAEGCAIVTEYSDEDASAYSGSRGPGLIAARGHAERLAAEYGECELWVFDPDRLARGSGRRGTAHLAQVYWWSVEVGVTLRAVQNDQTLRDPIYATIEGQRTHGDSKAKSGRVRRGKKAAALRGDPSGTLADGYRVIRWLDDRGNKRHRWVKNPERAPIYDLIWRLAADGLSDRAIVIELDRIGARTNPVRRDHSPGPFDAHRVRSTLTNPLYAGLATYKGEIVGVGEWKAEAYVTPDDFKRIQVERRERAGLDGPRKPGRPPSGFVLGGVARCECGAPVDGVSERYVRKDGTRRRTYTCRAHRERPGDCARRPIDAALIDNVFINSLTGFLGDVDGWRERLVHDRETERARMATEVERAEKALADINRRLSLRTAELDRWTDAEDHVRAEISMESVMRCRSDKERARNRLWAAQDALSSVADTRPDNIDGMLDFFAGLRAELSGRVTGPGHDDVRRLNAVVREYFSEVVLTATGDGNIEIAPWLSSLAVERVIRAQGLEMDEDGFPDTITIGHPPPVRAMYANPDGRSPRGS